MIKQLLFICFLTFTCCSTPKYTAETKSVKPVASTLVQVKTGGYGNTKKQASANAVENAFKTLLVYGVQESNQETALLGANAESKFSDNSNFFNELMTSKLDYFIVSKKVKGFKFTNDKTPSTEVELLINLKSLRNHLISNDIISEFGL